MELQREIDESTILVGDLNTPLIRNRSKGKKISKDIFELNSTIGQLDTTDNCRLCRIQLSNSHETFPKMDHIWGPKVHVNKCKRIENIQYLLSDHSGI